MALVLIVLFLLLPLAELYVIITIGREIGALPTIGLLAADSLVGAFLLLRQGRSAWNEFNQALWEGRLPHREIIDGVLVIFGGALLLTPGFITDAAGLLLLLPPTRHTVRRVLMSLGWRRLRRTSRIWGRARASSDFHYRKPADSTYEDLDHRLSEGGFSGDKEPPPPRLTP